MIRCVIAAVALLAAGAVQAQTVIAQPDAAGAVAEVFRDPAQDAATTPEQFIADLRRRVRYVFVLFQENRSFDHYFGTFPGANGLFSDGLAPRPVAATPGFTQPLLGTLGQTDTVTPFRLGPADHAADLDDVDHGHERMAAKMHLVAGVPQMDRFALLEEQKYSPAGAAPSLRARQYGQLTMAYVDCDTVPFLWRYASRFTLFDNIFQTTIGPSTPNAIAMIAGQAGETQWVQHPDKPGLPVLADPIPYWGSEADPTAGLQRQPANPAREHGGPSGANTAPNLTFASLPLTLAGQGAADTTAADPHREDLADVQQDLAALSASGTAAVEWRWYQEGYGQEPNEPTPDKHSSYIGHHNGPQYFGYVANTPSMSANQRGLATFFDDVAARRLPAAGGVVFVRGGYTDVTGARPAWDDGSPAAKAVQLKFQGDDDHPGYADSELSEGLVARSINAIARSPYWDQSAIIITYDESEGDYDHVPPRILSFDSAGLPLSRGPRIPLLLVSPFARAHAVSREEGDHASVIALVDAVFGLPPLARLPDEVAARLAGQAPRFATDGAPQMHLGPHDADTPGTGALLSGFDPARLSGAVPPLPAIYAELDDAVVNSRPHYGGEGCRAIGMVPEDVRQGIATTIPPDFNPRPTTVPSPP